MIVDSSAIVALIADEPEAPAIRRCLRSAAPSAMSAASYLETSIVLDGRRDPATSRRLDPLLEALGIEVVAVTPHQARIARSAYRDFGRGSGHPAHLNFGDCFSYALAIDVDQPLLFKGGDFVHTDVQPALPEGSREADEPRSS